MATDAGTQPPVDDGRPSVASVGTVATVADDIVAASRALVGIAVRSLGSLEDDDVTLPQFRALLLLGAGRASGSGDLAGALGVHPSNTTRMVDRLVAKGLVRRVDGADRRHVGLVVTEQGELVVRRVLEARRALVADVVHRLEPGEGERVSRALRRFATAAGEPADDAWWLGWG
jgi:DNA-binding MarR family transcriptional regulator